MALISLNIGALAPQSVPQAAISPATREGFDLAELGATGTPIFGGFLREMGEYNPELTGLSAYRIYEKMRRSDAQVRATLAAVKLPIRGAEWTVQEPKDASPVEKEATQFVHSCLMEELDFDSIIKNACLMLDFGAAAHEDVYYIDGDRVRLRKCAPRLPLTFYRWLTADGSDDLVALEQMGYRGSSYEVTRIPASKLALFTFDQEGSNFTGISLCRAMYQHWFIKANLYKVEAIACERNGMGVPWIQMAAGQTGAEDRKVAMEWLANMAVNESTGLLTPPGWAFDLVGVKGTIQSPKEAIDHHNSMISMAGLAQFINLGHGGSSGNRSLGQTMSDFFYLSLQATANQIARVISLGTVKRLCDLNFTGLVNYPRVMPQQILSIKIESLVDALSKLAAGEVDLIQPDDDAEDWMRQKLGMPTKNKPRPRQTAAAPEAIPPTNDGTTLQGSEAAAKTFAPKREPRGAEKYMALSEISSKLDQGRDEISAALRAARPRIQAEVVHKLMSRPIREAHRVSVDLDAKLVDQIEGILAGVSSYGLSTVGDERSRQSAGKKPATAATIRAAVKRDPLGIYADGVVSEFTNNLQQRAANVVLDQRRGSGTRTAGEQILQAQQDLDDQSDGWIDSVSSKGASEAFADGRADGYEQYKDEIGEVIYSALLDLNTCEPCSDADGQSGETPDDIPDVPNPDCDGGDKCRCVHVFVFSDESKGAE